ncbi:hypothetical protein HC928_00295 [bacterium]|nr:hypothetical protein [bacterium]
MVAQTELHRAKVAGQAQAIVNKIDIYANSAGANSEVSIVPSASCCDDCREHYLEPDGTPKIFILKDLISAGSNADPGVRHSKRGGVHIHWKTTLPPLHANCYCNIQYIPPGFGWAQGKLTMLNKSLFEASIVKSASGVSGGISPTVTPKGPPQSKPPSASAGVGSVPGVAAPGNTPGPGRPPGTPSTSPQGVKPKSVACPLGADCPDGGHHRPDSVRYREHMEQARASGKMTPQAKEEQKAEYEKQSSEFNKKANPTEVIKDHLSNGKIGYIERRGTEDSGINASYNVHIVGNGSGLMKPPIDFEGQIPSRRKEGKSPEEIAKLRLDLCLPGMVHYLMV